MKEIKLEYGETIIGEYGLFWDDKIKSISESGHVYITTKRLVLSYAKLHVFRADEEYSYSYPLSSIDHIEVTQLPKNSRDDTWYKCKAYLSNGVIHFSGLCVKCWCLAPGMKRGHRLESVKAKKQLV